MGDPVQQNDDDIACRLPMNWGMDVVSKIKNIVEFIEAYDLVEGDQKFFIIITEVLFLINYSMVAPVWWTGPPDGGPQGRQRLPVGWTSPQQGKGGVLCRERVGGGTERGEGKRRQNKQERQEGTSPRTSTSDRHEKGQRQQKKRYK